MDEATEMNAAGPVVEPMADTDQPELTPSRAALVAEWCEKIEKARKHWAPVFKAMRKAQDFALYGAEKSWRKGNNYTVPILPRYINQVVAQLYAKNPKAVFKRRPRLQYKIWDERSDSLQAAMHMAQMGDPSSMALIQEVLQVRTQDLMLDRMGKTLEGLFEYYLNEQDRNYKQQLKAAVRRAKISKVAWIKLGYQRMLEPRPEVSAQIADVTSKIANIQATLAKMSGDEYDDQSACVEELKLNMADLQRDQFMVVREGLVLDFPKPDQILVDPECTHLKSLSGANWLVHEYEMMPKKILGVWGVDIGTNFNPYDRDGKPMRESRNDKAPGKECARVYEIWDKENQQKSVIVDGYKDFIVEPATPDIYIERFWPLFPIVFNEVEHYEEIYPLSDVEQAWDIQNEYNRSREALREHRIAGRPYWVEGVGMSKEEKSKLADHSAHEVISVPTLGTGQKIEEILQRGPTAPIDPNLYELESHFTDLTRVIGFQEAQIGGVSGATATESSIAQQAQSSAQGDNVDDLDSVLTELARAAGQVLLLNVEKQTVLEIVGDGAVWPDSPETREEVAKELYLEVEAGSSGRPNKAADLANMERAVPIMQMLPGINPTPLGKKYLTLLDIDPDEGIAEGLPSMTALNALITKMATGGGAMGAAPTGDAQTDPNAQGATGASNAPSAQQSEPGPQPAYTAPSVPA